MAYDKTTTPRYIYHYTTIDGCEGILRSNTLYASNINFLNDRRELRFVDNYITEKVAVRFNEIFSDLIGRQIMNQPVDPEMLAKSEAENFIEAIHRTSKKLSPTFVVSFCRATTSFIENNGLLSQWRGYGQEGGIALRFDVEKLTALLKAESEKYDLMSTFIGDVIYGDEDQEFKEIAPELDVFSAAVSDIVESMLKKAGIEYEAGGQRASLDEMHRPYSSIAPRLKHPGFIEEAEYRIAVSAWIGEREPDSKKIRKPIYFRKRENYLVPYIELNDSNDTQLPIDQIIVGPSKEMTRRFDAVFYLVNECSLDAEILQSDIPFA